MKSGQVTPYTDTCIYLSSIICSHVDNVIIDNGIADLNMGLNNLIAKFLHRVSGTVSKN